MDAVYGQNHTVVLNFATQPCWLFGDAENKTQNCSYPENPDESFFGYVRGNRKNLLDPSGKTLASYFGRLLSYLVKGEFVDEDGVKHTGGPAYSRFNRKNGHVWELFNEAEHGYTVEQCLGRIIFYAFCCFLISLWLLKDIPATLDPLENPMTMQQVHP